MELPGRGKPTVPVVPFGVLISRVNAVPFVDHLDEKRPNDVEKPASTSAKSPTWGTIAHVAPAGPRSWIPATYVCTDH